MALAIQAPYPTLQTTTYLPNPSLGDSVNPVLNLDIKRSMNGTKYSYVTTRDRDRLIWSFRLSMHKYMELREFYNSYSASQLKITDHLGNVYIGYFVSNPFEFESVGRASDSPGVDTDYSIQIEFEGTKQ